MKGYQYPLLIQTFLREMFTTMKSAASQNANLSNVKVYQAEINIGKDLFLEVGYSCH